MGELIIRNRSSKISPGGVITLPLSARRALGMTPKLGVRVTVAVEEDCVILHPTSDQAGSRVSPKGQIEVVGNARRLLEQGVARHYWLEVNDAQKRVALHPYASE
jgi:bifunctional DNA-binding transcriptional regulator/antitoxin component of YhaV-PrlF toxin-antitoxin module